SLANNAAIVVAAERGFRPAVVLPRLDDVHLVAAIRTLFAFPQVARDRIDVEAEPVAMTERINLRQILLVVDERIVRRHGPIVTKTEDLAVVGLRILRDGGNIAVAAA